jgi:CBS domain-containing protein
MQLKDVMTREVAVVPPDATLEHAAARMRDLNVGSLPVCDGERLLGMVTDRDITVRSTAAGRDPGTVPVREAMTDDVVYGFEDQDVQEAARVMEERQIRRLVVLNQEKQLVGIVSVDDLAVDASARLAGEVVQGAAQPTPQRP